MFLFYKHQMKKSEFGKKKLVLNRQEHRMRFPSLNQSPVDSPSLTKNNSDQTALRHPINISRLNRAGNIEHLTNKGLKPIKYARSLSKFKEGSQQEKKKELIIKKQDKSSTNICKRSLHNFGKHELSEIQIMAFIKNQNLHTQKKIFTISQNKLIFLLLEFQDYRNEMIQPSVKPCMTGTASLRLGFDENENDHCFQVSQQIDYKIRPSRVNKNLKSCSAQVKETFSWSPTVEETALVWKLCTDHDYRSSTQEELDLFRRTIGFVDQKIALTKKDLECIEQKRKEAASLYQSQMGQLEKVQSDIEEKKNIIQQLHSRINRMSNFMFNTANPDIRERAAQYKKTENGLFELALKSNIILASEIGPEMERQIAGEDSYFDLELEKFYYQIKTYGKFELDKSREISSYKRRLMSCYNATKNKMRFMIIEKHDQIKMYAEVVKKMAERLSAKRSSLNMFHDNMVVAILKLDELTGDIEHKLPECFPQLNHNIPITECFKNLQSKIQKLISIYEEVNIFS